MSAEKEADGDFSEMKDYENTIHYPYIIPMHLKATTRAYKKFHMFGVFMKTNNEMTLHNR